MRRLLFAILLSSFCCVSLYAAKVKNGVVKEVEDVFFSNAHWVDCPAIGNKHILRLKSILQSDSLNRYDASRAQILLQLCYYGVKHIDFNAAILASYSSKLSHNDSLYQRCQKVLFKTYCSTQQYQRALLIGNDIEKRSSYLSTSFFYQMAEIHEQIGSPSIAADYYWKILQSDIVSYEKYHLFDNSDSNARNLLECYRKYNLDTTQYRYRFCDSIAHLKPYKRNLPLSPNALGNILLGWRSYDSLAYLSRRTYVPEDVSIELAQKALQYALADTSKYKLWTNPESLSAQIGNTFISTHQLDSALTYMRMASEYSTKSSYYSPNGHIRTLLDLANSQINMGLLYEADSTISKVGDVLLIHWGIMDDNITQYVWRQKYGDLQGGGVPKGIEQNYLLISERLYATIGDSIRANKYSTLLQQCADTLNLPLSQYLGYQCNYYHNNTRAYIAYKQNNTDELYRLLAGSLDEMKKYYYSYMAQTYRSSIGVTAYSSSERQNYMYHLSLIGSNIFIYADHTRDARITQLAYNYALFNKQLLLSTDKYLLTADSDTAKSLVLARNELLKQRQTTGSIWKRDSIQKQIDDIERKLLVQHSDSVLQEKVVTYEQLRSHLSDRAACIELIKFVDFADWQMTGHTYYAALLLRRNDSLPVFIRLCDEQDLLINTLQDASTISRYYEDETLAQNIWEPLMPYLSDVSIIYFACDGFLHQIALEASMLSAGRYARDRFDLIRLTSTKDVCAISTSAGYHAQIDRAALYGNIDYGTTGKLLAKTRSARNLLDPLSYSEQEISRIGQILNNHHVSHSIYRLREATESSMTELSGHSPGILHFSTHGFSFSNDEALELPYYMNQNTPYIPPMERNGLYFANAAESLSGVVIRTPDKDGVLTAEEIETLNLSGTQMVVLSACNTGLGDISSEGVWGLQRAFKMAGVKSMVMSLWSVDDEATAILMQLFYEELFRMLALPFAPHEALITAQRRMQHHPKYSAPYYWAGFIVVD